MQEKKITRIKITDSQEIQSYLITFFKIVGNRRFEDALNSFKKLIGFSTDYESILFKSDLKECGLEAFESYSEIGERQIELSRDLFAVKEEVYMYISFEVLYDFLKEWIIEQHDNNPKLLILLEEVKIALEV